MHANPHIVSAVVVEENGKILMVQESRADVRGKWNLPAGRLDEGENLLDCAVREAREETGCDVELTGFIGVYNRLVAGKHFSLVSAFAGKRTGGKPTPSPEHPQVKFLTMSEIESLEAQGLLRSPHVMNTIRDYRTRPLLPLETVRTFETKKP